MKVAILAGGKGTRLAEETEIRPKPMVEIGGRPILWHIMKLYSHYGFDEFAIGLGYKGEYIKRWARNHFTLGGALTVKTGTGELISHQQPETDWTIHLVDTGDETQTGGRIKRLQPWLGNGTFMLTWGDGLADVDLNALLAFHKAHGKLATLTSVRPPARYGHLEFDGDQVIRFTEKPQTAEGWINGAFFVLEPAIFDYIEGDATQWEKEPLERLAAEGQLMAYRHTSFWQCMDTLREKYILERIWQRGDAPWKVWD
ncbi:MAG: glucose-1-phosphate cytidylyltransferase [bacterium]